MDKKVGQKFFESLKEIREEEELYSKKIDKIILKHDRILNNVWTCDDPFSEKLGKIELELDFKIDQEGIDNLLYFGINIETFIYFNEEYFYKYNLSKYFKKNIGACSLAEVYYFNIGKEYEIDYEHCYDWIEIEQRVTNKETIDGFEKLLDKFIKNSKDYVLEDLKRCINMTKTLDYLFLDLINKNNPDVTYEILRKLIFLGANVNKDLINKNNKDGILDEKVQKVIDALIDIDEKDCYIYNQYDFYKSLAEDLIYDHRCPNEQKEKCCELIDRAYYGQKISRYVKNALNDEFVLTKLRYNIEKRKYEDLIKT